MSVSYIPEPVKVRLWGLAAGRCEYDGCNEPLWLDSTTKFEFNAAYIAHIVADKPGGPRGDAVLSERLKAELSNLMLMCDKHHRLIDKIDIDGHPIQRLQAMKRKHERRIELLGSLMEDKQSHILIYGANIGAHCSPLSYEKAAQAMLPGRYPAENRPLELSLKSSAFTDVETHYWLTEQENLRRQFNQLVKPRLSQGQIEHLSIFGLAPQPLLIELGRLLSDIPAAEIFQLHREPPDWRWQARPHAFEFEVVEPSHIHSNVALNLSLSATIDNSRITAVLGDDVSVWTITHEAPNNDFLKSATQLSQFRQTLRSIFDRMKATHGENAAIHVFPACPVSVAIETGRVWMPKADLPLSIYDENRGGGGFIFTLDVR